MSPLYNPRTVVEKTPNALLQSFFSKFPSFSSLNWTNLAEHDAESILLCVKEADRADQRLLGVRLRQVHALGDSAGTTALIAAARDFGLDLGSRLKLMDNAYERAFWCLVEHPAIFDSQRIYVHTHALRSDSRESRVGFPNGNVIVTPAMIDDLVSHIKDAYKDEHRADVCSLDHREQDGVHLFHAYPSDYVDEIDTYGPDGQLSSVRIQPPFHIVCYLDEHTGTMTLFAKGGTEKHEALFKGFATAIHNVPAPPKAGNKTYDLSPFKNPNREFVTDPAHHLGPPRVVRMHLQFPESRHHRAWFEVDPHDRHDNIYNVLRGKLRGGIEELARATILSVELQAVFNVPGEREEEIHFRTTVPRWCTLGHEGKEAIVRRHLRPWGIENDGKRVAALPKAAGIS